ncbi:odontogenic ameloblast-associated protein [Nycticebus coucang]|uniref:odontogenic ameloblast-associated protein n=1 Tax=Nycticebus coucang TaxID=9470 RepID=UPI00234CBB4F|nr:odontogenic ameloblast-associated protein [Nycticebus coucang]
MKIIILLGLLGATLSAPLVPQNLLSTSNSNELLLNLPKAQLVPLQLQGPFDSWIPPFSGALQQQQQAHIPDPSQFYLPSRDWFAGLFPNQIPFPGQLSFAQGAQAGRLDPSQAPTPGQPQQGPHQVMPYIFSFKVPQEQAQLSPYYPVYMFLPWEQPPQVAAQPPPQPGPQQQQEQAIPGGQQLAFDPLLGTAPEMAVMPVEGVIPYLQKEVMNFRQDNVGVFMPPTSPKPSTTKLSISSVNPTITPGFLEEKVG